MKEAMKSFGFVLSKQIVMASSTFGRTPAAVYNVNAADDTREIGGMYR